MIEIIEGKMKDSLMLTDEEEKKEETERDHLSIYEKVQMKLSWKSEAILDHSNTSEIIERIS